LRIFELEKPFREQQTLKGFFISTKSAKQMLGEDADYQDDFLAAYVCTKKAEAVGAKSLTVAGQQLR
jgi:hypothetical protein